MMGSLTKEDWENYKKAVEESVKKMTMALKENFELLKLADRELNKVVEKKEKV